MELKLVRDIRKPECTLGQLFVNGTFDCYTVEDVVRPRGQKIHGKTAIPEGRYRVVIPLQSLQARSSLAGERAELRGHTYPSGKHRRGYGGLHTARPRAQPERGCAVAGCVQPALRAAQGRSGSRQRCMDRRDDAGRRGGRQARRPPEGQRLP